MIRRKYFLGKENQIGQFIDSPTLLHKRFRMTTPKSLMLHKSSIFFLTEIYMGIGRFLIRESCITFLSIELPEIEIQEVLCRGNILLL